MNTLLLIAITLALGISASAQVPSPTEPVSSYERLSLISALALAVGIQYRENREKDKLLREQTKEMMRHAELMAGVAEALERLSDRIEDSRSHTAGQ